MTPLVLCSALSVVCDVRTYAALPVALPAALALATDRLPAVRRHPVVAGCVEAIGTGLAVSWTGGADSPMLPYLLVPGLDGYGTSRR
ncbi:MAG: hypothetical protein JWN08_2222 [Frankiales bacterium]|nr:hypothetical protein [Frankiales bacterium]